ncbi:MAG TPA: cob(I)yrinic acid a,c-diamide adenosyltransferase [Anaerolineae bacterium]|nr:cob(I)yrinic acid a,c-diamide adenosyltransferase [Anaerolineae bacterium]
MNNRSELGLLHVYTGDGKGKTTAAIGLALRAVASGLRICIIQFMKARGEESGEIRAIKRFENVSASRYGENLLEKDHAPVDVIKSDISKGLEAAIRAIKDEECDILILDEINVALSMGLANKREVLKVVGLCKGSVELVLTGRGADQELIDIADYVTEFKMVKHPFGVGITARRGIEY